jgi:hypothetical protein
LKKDGKLEGFDSDRLFVEEVRPLMIAFAFNQHGQLPGFLNSSESRVMSTTSPSSIPVTNENHSPALFESAPV